MKGIFSNVRNKFDCASKALARTMESWMFNESHGAVQTVRDCLRNVGFDTKTTGWYAMRVVELVCC